LVLQEPGIADNNARADGMTIRAGISKKSDLFGPGSRKGRQSVRLYNMFMESERKMMVTDRRKNVALIPETLL